MGEKLFHKINQITEKPIALIIESEKFVGDFLKKALALYGCEVETIDDINKIDFKKSYNYLFCFTENLSQLKKIFVDNFSQTKIVIALPYFPQQSVNYKNLITQADQKNFDLRIVYYSYVYGPGMDQSLYRILDKLIDRGEVAPIFISDFIYGLLKATFAGGTKDKIFSLLSGNQDLGWQPKVNLEDGLQQTKNWFLQSDQKFDLLKREHRENKNKIGINLKKRSAKLVDNKIDNNQIKQDLSVGEHLNLERQRNKFFSFLIRHALSLTLCFFLLVVSYPLTSVLFYGLIGARSLKQAQVLALEGDLNRAHKKSLSAKNNFYQGRQQLLSLNEFLQFFSKPMTDRANNLFYLGQTTADGLTSFTQAGQATGLLVKAIFSEETIDVEGLIKDIKLDLEKSFNQLSLAESQFDQGQELEQLKEVRSLILRSGQGLDLLPSLLALRERKSYLVLFQNNSELRPTGGFIGSYGILTFDNGQFIDFEIKDVYSADGQLKGHVEPPGDLKKYLGEAGWYLRDSNWDPDFPTSAKRAAWFLEKETGRAVDGVIAINLFLAQKILTAVGEIQIPDYQEKINADNFFERAEYYSEINFFPGSTQKQDFLGGVARVLFEEIKEADQKTWLKLAQNIYPTINAKDLLIWLPDQNSLNLLQQLGWGGDLKSVNCRPDQKECLTDFLMLVEANVGINKANYFLKRSLNHQIKIEEDGTVEEILQANYQNNSQSEAFPAGRYKTYLRVYTPLNSKLVKIEIKDPATGELKEVEEIEEQQDHNKQIFGFLLEVPIQESRSIEIIYRLDKKLNKDDTAYRFYLQKQPGIQDETFSLWFKPYPGLVASANYQANQTTQGLVFSPDFNQDLLFEINLTR